LIWAYYDAVTLIHTITRSDFIPPEISSHYIAIDCKTQRTFKWWGFKSRN